MSSLWRDLRYSLRLLRLTPGFTLIAILTLALGVGANTAIFQLIDAIRLRTIPVKDPERLAIVKIADRSWNSGNFNGPYADLTFPLWQLIRQRQEGFSSIAAWGPESFNLATGGEVHYAHGIWVSGEFFDVLGVQPFMGRLLSTADDQPGCAAGPAVISYAFWQRNFGGSREVLGKRFTLEGISYEVAGVTPAAFRGISVGDSFDVAVPICSEPVMRKENSKLMVRHSWWLAALGRLKPGWSIAQATAQLKVATPAMLQETIPPFYDADGAKKYLAYRFAAFPASNGFSSLREDSSTPLWLLLGISGLVLLIACANLANLMLARASARERQISIRLALGAPRGVLIRQMLLESFFLAVGGAICGVLLAATISRFLVAFISTPNDPIFLDLAMDWRMLAFTTGLAMLTTVLFGLAPALRVTRTDPAAALQAESRGTTGSRERFSLRRALVSSQVALSLVLLVAALLFVRSLRNLLTTDAGFQQTGIISTAFDFSKMNLPADRRPEFQRELLARVRAIPGVDAAANVMRVPIGGSSSNDWLLDNGDSEHREISWLNDVSPGYFETLQIPILAGRDFNDGDTASSPKVAIVNQAFVRKFVKATNPLGQTFRLWEPPGKPVPVYQIVGVVKDSKYRDLHEEISPTAFFPLAQQKEPDKYGHILVRSALPPGTFLTSLKETITSVNPDLDLDIKVFENVIRETLTQDELMATLAGFFGFLAAVLAALGLYGVISYMVVQRTKEIGIRMAIGAEGGHVIGMILREAGMLTMVGIVVGTGLALSAAQVAKSLLFGLKPRDPLTFVLAAATLAGVAALASFVPAYRASRVDPLVALRYE